MSAACAGADVAGVHVKPLPGRQSSSPGFRNVAPDESGLNFVNQLEGDTFLTNAVAHNGSGVALGDVDGDGLPDIYLCGLQNPNRLFRNLGGWKFEPIPAAGIECPDQFSTGAVFADVDGDGDPDLLVNGIGSGTRLFLNLGQWQWQESADSGLSQSASPTSMALADIDADGDLDLYCTHYVDEMHIADPTVDYKVSRRNGQYVVTHVNGVPATGRLANRFVVSESGELRELPETDGLYINDGLGHFQNIAGDMGVFSDAGGKPMDAPRDWGLAVTSGDFNRDGLIDFYVCNDNASPDRVWLNLGGRRFREAGGKWFRHTSRSSMGVDVADFNGDGLEDVFVVDMLASDPGRRLTQLVKQHSSPIEQINPNEVPRFNRNTLFEGREDAPYSEVALMAGVAATDWSWCPIFMDVDLDGFTDLLITNGFSFDVMDQDSNDHIRNANMTRPERRRSRKFHPYYGSPNLAFRNNGAGGFDSATDQWSFGIDGISNGAACADLDLDGDPDLVINRMNQPALILENRSAAPRIHVRLRGKAPNTDAIGARIILKNSDGSPIQSARIQSGGRYLSGDAPGKSFAAGDSGQGLDQATLEIHWPTGSVSRIGNLKPDHSYVVTEAEIDARKPEKMTEVPDQFMSPLTLPNRWLPELQNPAGALEATTNPDGPGLAAMDLDGNGWTDIIHAAGRGQSPLVLLNQEGRSFLPVNGLPPTQNPETVVVPWWDNQGTPHWIAAVSPRSAGAGALHIYSLDGDLHPRRQVLQSPGSTGIGSLCVLDVDGDGDLDLFSGGVPRPDRYPEPAPSHIWIQESGQLTVSESWSHPFQSFGIARDAAAIDWDFNGTTDLVVANEAGAITIFLNSGDAFAPNANENVEALADAPGFWSSIILGDWNGDGLWDIAAGNRGLNSSLALHPGEAWRVSWLPGPGPIRSFESVLRGTRWFPCTDRTNLGRAFPAVVRSAPSHEVYSGMSVDELLGSDSGSLKSHLITCLESSLFLSSPDGLNRHPLPLPVQASPVTALASADFNGDGFRDLFVAQNDFSEGPRSTRNDNGIGLLLTGTPESPWFQPQTTGTGLMIPGEMRGAVPLDINRDAATDLLAAAIGSPSTLHVNQRPNQSTGLKFSGPLSNPAGIGFSIRLKSRNAGMGAWIPLGDSCGPHSGAPAPVSIPDSLPPGTTMEIRHPNGEIRSFSVPDLRSSNFRIRWTEK